MAEELEGYITVPQAAQKIQRSTEQVRRYLREGKLEGRRLGGQWYIKESAVAYLVRGQQETTAETHPSVEEEEQLPMGIDRKVVFDRIKARKDAIRERWEEGRVKVDAAALVRELREEAH
jgi:hypothetical protein